MSGMAGTTPVPAMANPSASPPSQAHPPPPLARPLNGSGGGAAAPSVSAPPPNASRLTFDDMAKHFNVPIAEAASALGVCSSVLKRICRENGVVRWPYRKFLAGKTVDDIKRDAAKEKIKESSAFPKLAKEMMMPPNSQQPAAVRIHSTPPPPPPLAFSPAAIHVPGNPPAPSHAVPDYVDEFKHGFPASGLASTAHRWWGCGGDAEEGSPPESESSFDDDESPDESDSSPAASSSLCSLRRRAVREGEESLRLRVFQSFPMGERKP